MVESLKGDAASGEDIYVVVTAGHTTDLSGSGRLEFVSYEVVPVSPGLEYVLFLRSSAARPEYPSQYGSVVWSPTGHPGMAQIGPVDALHFKASERYRNEVDQRGLERKSASAAPFELTKEYIKTRARDAAP